MLIKILTVVASLLTIAIGLWKYFTDKERVKAKRRQEAGEDIKEGMKENDPSKITANLDRLNRN